MAELNSTLVKASRYVSGGISEVNAWSIEWWERAVMPTNNDDSTYVVEATFANRLDLIATLFWAEPRWWWVIAQYNNILDPSSEVVEGVILYIPTLEKVKLLLSGKLGGAPSTREVAPSILPIV